MPEAINQIHLAVYANLMEWRRHMYEEQKDGANTVLGVAGETWHWASLTEGDLKFIAGEVAKLQKVFPPFKLSNSSASSKVGVHVIKDKLEEDDLLAE